MKMENAVTAPRDTVIGKINVQVNDRVETTTPLVYIEASTKKSDMNYPKKVTIGDITVRDGFQHEETFIPTDAKVWLAEQLILAGFRHIEVTNLGNPVGNAAVQGC